MPRRVSLKAEFAAIMEASRGRSLRPDELQRIERLNAVEAVRKSRLPRQIRAARAKLERLEAEYHG